MLDFKETYILRNDIAELRPLEKSHKDGLYAASNDQDIWTYFTEPGYGQDNFKKYFLRALKMKGEGKEYPFVIKDIRTNEIAGMTRLYEYSSLFGNIKIGHTWIGKKFQGTGLNKANKYLLFEFLFDQMNIKRIGFGANANNATSIAAMKSVGCKEEGFLRSFLIAKDGKSREDVILLSILYEDWDQRIRKELGEKVDRV
ncbi:MAG: GNAT family protein, partial [Bacteroidota bacterium]